MKKSNNTTAPKASKVKATSNKKIATVAELTAAAPVESLDVVYDIAELDKDDVKLLRYICEPITGLETVKQIVKSASEAFNYKSSIVSKSAKKLIAKGYIFENEGKVEINHSSLPEDYLPAPNVSDDKIGDDKIGAVKAIVTVSTAPVKHAPYKQFGIHGSNVDLEGFVGGERVKFQIKGKDAFGKYIHFHTNNHSPKGYAVIRGEDGRIYERVQSKFELVVEETPVPVKKAAKKKATAPAPEK